MERGMLIKDVYAFVGMISHWDLHEHKPSLEELVGMAKQFNRDAGTGFLARLNVYLSKLRRVAEGQRSKVSRARVLVRIL